ncbi:MAG: dihydroneopterin aldolase [Verrucomicrobiales bacterium]|nr:dihydroneopterin aldolase [Verrucomicrobiales bacterium]
MSDRIHIKKLLLPTVVGVPDEERELPQTVSVTAAISLSNSIRGIGDNLQKTVDYYEVTQAIRAVASSEARKLIETLAEEISAAIFAFDGVESVTLEVEKFIIPNCGSVSIEITRNRE